MTKPRANPKAPWADAKASRRIFTSSPDWATGHIALLRGACHPKQLQIVDDPSLLITALVARGGGKSTGAWVRLLETMMCKPRARTVFVAVTKEHAADIIWEKVKTTIEKAGIEARFSETKKVVTLVQNGSTLKLAGADDNKEIEKLRGIPFDGVVIDEAASHSAKLLASLVDRIIGPRLGERDGWLMLIGTPGHELRGMFYDATRPGSDRHRPYEERDKHPGWDGWSSHHWTIEDGAAHVPAMSKLWAAALKKKKLEGWSDTHPIWMREYLGKWAADDTDAVFRYRAVHEETGEAWNQWDPERDGVFAKLPLRDGKPVEDWLHMYALDKGFHDDFAINVFSFSPTDPGKALFHTYCHEEKKLYARRIAQLFLGEDLEAAKPAGLFGQRDPVGVVGDIDDAFATEMSNFYGIRIKIFIKRRDYKAGAIELVNGDLVDGRIKVLKGSPLEIQLTELQWVADEFGRLSENKAQANHSSDCLIMGRKEVAHLFETGAVDAAPSEKRRRGDPPPDDLAPPVHEWSDLLSSGSYDTDPW